MDAVAALAPTKRARHLFLDRSGALRQTEPERQKEHGYYGQVTDMWARVLTLLACGELEQ